MGLLGPLKRGRVFVVSAPAGTGKTTLVERLVAEYPESIQRSISCTTRSLRKGENDGHDYIYLSKEAFEKKINEEAFLEYAEVFGYYYGTLKQTVKTITESGKHVFLVIDTQGALKLKSLVEAAYIFIEPPSMEELGRRLRQRSSETVEKIKERLSWAIDEIKMANHYDYVIINDRLDDAYQRLVEIVQNEERQHCI